MVELKVEHFALATHSFICLIACDKERYAVDVHKM